MRTLCYALGLVVIATSATRATAQQPVKLEADSISTRYHELLARLIAGDVTLDVTALRLAWANSSDYDPYHWVSVEYRDSVQALLARGDYRRVVERADSALSVDYVNPLTHIDKAYAAEQLGDTASAEWHRRVGFGFVHSVTRSGLGSVDSPYVVVSLAEEYAVLAMMGYRFVVQELGECGTRRCDVLTAIHHQSREIREFYFDISLFSGGTY